MRWVFVRPQIASSYYDPEIQEPLGVEYLAAARRACRDQVLVLDGMLSLATENRLARRLVSFAPDVVGFSLTTALDVAQAVAIRAQAEPLLAERPIRWLAGGNFVSTEPERAAALLPPDFTLVRLEAEEALAMLASRWASGNDWPGTVDGTAVLDLDRLPFPERPFAQEILAAGWTFNLQGSRGCHGTCRYCASPGMRPREAPGWRGRSPIHVAEEIELLNARFGARAFNFIDEDFLGVEPAASRRALTFAEELRRRHLRISFGIQARPGSLSERTIDALSEAGLTYAFVGLESDAPEDIARWGRRPQDDAWKVVARLRAQNVEVHAGTLLFHHEATLASLERFGRRLEKYGLLDFLAANNRLDAMPGSVLYRLALDRGDLDPSLAGPQPLPFADPTAAAFYDDIVAALAPLGPPWMQAACSLPPLLARARLEGSPPAALKELRPILSALHAAIAEAFFGLLARHSSGTADSVEVQVLRRRHLELGCEVARALVAGGLAPSFEGLREAIRKDAWL